MKRALQFSCVVILAFLGLVVSPSIASAADSFTIDELPGGRVTVSGDMVTFSGTVSVEDSDLDIFVFIDGRLLTCDGDPSNDFNDFDCVRTWTDEGTTWTFPVSRDELELLGLTFLGPHDVRFVLTRFVDTTHVTQAEKTLSLDFGALAPTETPAATPAPPQTAPHNTHKTRDSPSFPFPFSGLVRVTQHVTSHSILTTFTVRFARTSYKSDRRS